jgi:hypothetical protein
MFTAKCRKTFEDERVRVLQSAQRQDSKAGRQRRAGR